MNEDRTLQLPDGRCMGYAAYGAEQGLPVLFCHGTPGSRLGVTLSMAQTAEALGVWLIVPDRPGYGRSDPKPNRSLIDWPDDAAVLMDALGIGRFTVVSFSCGSLYALACAWAMPQRVTALALVSPLAPNVLAPGVVEAMSPVVLASLTQARDDPEGLTRGLAPLAQAPEQLFNLSAGSVSPADQEVLTQSEVSEAYQRDCRESLAQGVEAMVRDFVLSVSDWGFALEAVGTPVTIWQGLADLNSPPAVAAYLAEHLPRCRLHTLPGEGHLCLFAHWDEVMMEQRRKSE